MKPFQPRKSKESMKNKSLRNKIAFILLLTVIGLLVNNAVMSHDNKINDTEHLKEVE